MGKGRRRNTAKTGDKALYSKRSNETSNPRSSRGGTGGDKDDDDNGGDDDAMYDRVDKFHNRREQDFLRLTGQEEEEEDDDDDDDGNYDSLRPVMDLGIGASSDEDDDDDDDDDDDEESSGDGDSEPRGTTPRAKAGRDRVGSDDGEDDGSTTSDEDDDDDEEEEEEEEEADDVRDWGKRKSAYYHGDTADLEIGQDHDDAFLEEEAAKEIHRARMAGLAEEDFEIDGPEGGGEGDHHVDGTTATAASARNVHKLTRREKRKIIDKQSPEFLPLVDHFTDVVRELHGRTEVAVKALFEGEDGAAEAVGATPLGCEYLLTKAIIETASALNLASYLLLKRELPANDTTLSCHPVLSQLQKLHKQHAQLEQLATERHPELNDQLDKLVEAVALMKEGLPSEDENDATDGDRDNNDDSGEGEPDDESTTNAEENESTGAGEEPTVGTDKKKSPPSSSSDEGSEPEAEDARRRNVLNEARFALRPSELTEVNTTTGRKRRPAPDFGEDDEEELAGKKSKAFSATLNSIQQRSRATPKKSKIADELEDFMDRDNEFMADEEDEKLGVAGRTHSGARDGNGTFDPELEDDNEGGDFYSMISRKSKSRKDARKAVHQVAPKFPRVENEIDGERTVSKQILKNRGLVPHKNRLNRNPRVKKREQFRKALIRRRGAVREIRTDEGHKYGGEGTGIKTGLSRSRKLA